MGCPYIPKYTVGDVLSRDFIMAFIERKYPQYTQKALEARKLFTYLSWNYYDNDILSLEVAVCAMVPQDVPPTPAVIEPVVKKDICEYSIGESGCTLVVGTVCPYVRDISSCTGSKKKTLDSVG